LTWGVKKASKELKVRKPTMATGLLTNFNGGSAMRIGYARVSTHDQNLDLQKDALKKAGCEKVIVDVGSGKKDKRSGLERARDQLRKGDVLVVWRLDRLGRSLKHLIELMNEMERAGIGFCSLQESINTTTPGGKLVFHIFGALAEFERNLIRERTKAGLDAARARGRKGGRPKALDVEQRTLAVDLYEQRKHTVEEICRTLGISKPTLYGYVREKRA
jgi:DNA invertase Pin-like site-specific DNA recombinase